MIYILSGILSTLDGSLQIYAMLRLDMMQFCIKIAVISTMFDKP